MFNKAQVLAVFNPEIHHDECAFYDDFAASLGREELTDEETQWLFDNLDALIEE